MTTTPSITRAAEAYVYNSTNGLHARPEPREVDLVRKVLSAALHDPDHPDWLAEALYRADYPLSPRAWDDLNAVTHGLYRECADAVRAAILGADS